MSSTSETTWNLAQPHIDKILFNMKNYNTTNIGISLNLEYSLTRKLPEDAKNAKAMIQLILFKGQNYTSNRHDIIDKLYNNIKFCRNTPMVLPQFLFPVSLKIFKEF